MTDEAKFQRLHERVDNLSIKVDKNISYIARQLNTVSLDVTIIKNTIKESSVYDKLDSIDKLLRGNGGKGILARLYVLEQKNTGKEKFAWLIIGALCSGITALLVAFIISIAN